MIHFNQLSISSDGKHLIIDVSVIGEAYYKDVYIDSIVIDNQDTYVGNGPSSTPVYSYSVPETKEQKHVKLILDTVDIKNLNSLFFVYVRAKGTPAPDTPCGMDNITTMRTVTNMYPFYQQAMNYIGELANGCSIPQNFLDYVLKMRGLELAVKTGNYPDAIKFYNKFFNGKGKSSIKTGGCGCGNY
jgi:hypothetical protein